MDVVELLKEVRATAQVFGLTKWELYGLFIACLIVLRLPAILAHRREMHTIKTDSKVKRDRQQEKFKIAREKRDRKASRKESN